MAYTLSPARTGRYFPLDNKFEGKSPDGHTLSWTNTYLTVDGKPFFGITGEIHYSRLDPSRWEDALRKAKAFGSFLCGMETSLPENADAILPADTKTLWYAARRNGSMGFLFLNNFQDHADMQDKTDIVFELDTDQGRLRIPQTGSLSLTAGESCVLPFGLPVLGDTLAYATVQPVHIIQTASGEQRPPGRYHL